MSNGFVYNLKEGKDVLDFIKEKGFEYFGTYCIYNIGKRKIYKKMATDVLGKDEKERLYFLSEDPYFNVYMQEVRQNNLYKI